MLLKCEDSNFPPVGKQKILQSNLLFFYNIMMHIILIIHRFSIQLVTSKGFFILTCVHLYFLHSMFLLSTFMNHELRVCRYHYHVLIWLFYNKHIKFYALPLSWGALIFTYFVFAMCIDYIYINFCCPISTFIHQPTAIYASIKHNNRPF